MRERYRKTFWNRWIVACPSLHLPKWPIVCQFHSHQMFSRLEQCCTRVWLDCLRFWRLTTRKRVEAMLTDVDYHKRTINFRHCWQLSTHLFPRSKPNFKETLLKIQSAEYLQFEVNCKVSTGLRTVIESCFSIATDERPSVAQLISRLSSTKCSAVENISTKRNRIVNGVK